MKLVHWPLMGHPSTASVLTSYYSMWHYDCLYTIKGLGLKNRRLDAGRVRRFAWAATDHYTAIRWLVHWPLTGELLHLVQRGGAWADCGPASPLLAVPNVTAHPSTASVPAPYHSMWQYMVWPVYSKGLTPRVDICQFHMQWNAHRYGPASHCLAQRYSVLCAAVFVQHVARGLTFRQDKRRRCVWSSTKTARFMTHGHKMSPCMTARL